MKKQKLEELYKNKHILITGGTGFLGKNMVPYLKKLGADVVAIGSKEYEEDNFDSYMYAMKHRSYDYIFHGAAFQGAGDFTLKYPAEQFYINNMIHLKTLDAWHKYHPTAKIVGLGSTCSYPVLPVLKEEDYMSGKLHSSVRTYGNTKCNMVEGIHAYKKQYGLQGTTVVLATLYGPHDKFDLDKAHVVTALIKKFCDATKDNLPTVEVWGDGSARRELIYVEDQIEGILLGAQYDGDLINVGSGVETSIKNLAERIQELSGFVGKIEYNPNRFVGVGRKVLDISKAMTIFEWDGGSISLDDGLVRTIEWYKNNVAR